MPELKKYKMFIGGEWVESDTKKTFETLNPENNKPWAIVPEASANDVDKAVKRLESFDKESARLLSRFLEENRISDEDYIDLFELEIGRAHV